MSSDGKTRWQQLLSDERFGSRASEPDQFRSPFESDYDRVIYSAPFRRLARKTQVHPLSDNDHVRNRLTHSLEVVSVGRTFGNRLVRLLRDKGHLPTEDGASHTPWIMMAACAAHDIGNPPFGHAGEDGVRAWVKMHATDLFLDEVPVEVRTDLERFEGNAQGFRIAARNDNPSGSHLRLTYATLGAMVKYPWTSSDERASQNGKIKFNVYSTEQEIFEAVMTQLGLGDGSAPYVRHPMSFLSEAADDICYRVADLEDAVELGIRSRDDVRTLYGKIAETSAGDLPLEALRGKAIRALIDKCWSVFEAEYETILGGSRTADLMSGLDDDATATLGEVKRIYDAIFAERTKVATELGAYKALGRILRALCLATHALASCKAFKTTPFVARRAIQLAWSEEFGTKHEAQSYGWWIHQVMDFVAGLTDSYARQLSREIEGT
jgi:dGTPase